MTCSRDDAPVVTCTSNGDPPPESAFESCAFGARFGGAVEAAGGGATFVDDPTATDVGFGSTTMPCNDELDDCAASDSMLDVELDVGLEVTSVVGGGASDLELDACALVCEGGFALDAGGGGVGAEETAGAGAATCGHSAFTPMSFWKTPMMLVSPTSTSLQALLTTSPIFLSPATHASVHRAVALGSKSLAWQPSMVEVYAARHCAFDICRAWKFASWTVAVATAAVLRRA
jgi:hypothetical protein